MYIRDQIIQILTLARAEMHQAVSQIDNSKEIYDGWSLREVLAHVAGWDEIITAVLEAHSLGKPYPTPDHFDTETFNRKSHEARAAFSQEQVTADWEARREQLLSILNEMPEERFEQPVLFPWGQVGTVEDILRGFASHERRHAGEISMLAG